jgi:2-polyprenyl-6-methoxyphenol hydroxylase-like FAD-dependent oxidoreductase
MPQNHWPKAKLTESGGCGVRVLLAPDRSRREVEPVSDHAVLVVGGGPTGLMLAAELALAGIDIAIVERRAGQELIGARAGGLHSRTIEIFDQRGIADRFLSQGEVAQVAGFAQIRLDISEFPTRHPYGLALWQIHIERILADWVGELAVPIYRGREVTDIAQDRTGVDVELAGDEFLRAKYLVGCDGGRSVIREAAGIEFPGWDPATSYLLAEVEMAEDTGLAPEWGIRHDALGVHSLSTLEDGGPVRVMVTERHVGPAGEPTLRDLSEALIAVYGTDYGIHSPTWISRFTDVARQASTYRNGRVLLAGDAAHVHHPIGGQGLNTGVQDAVNLGWKLAQVVNQTSPESLLDTYHSERHPVAARVLRNAMAQMALLRPDDRTKALRNTISELLSMDEPRKRFAAMMSGLDIRYDLGERHPLLGRRMPDLDLVTANGPLRVFTLLHDARPVLLNLGEPGGFDIAPWANRVKSVDAKYVGDWDLPVLGTVTAPTAALIRPDGYVAWVGDLTDLELPDALTTWFGPASAAQGDSSD